MTLDQFLTLEAAALPILLPALGLLVRWVWGRIPMPAARRALVSTVVTDVVLMCEQVYPQLAGPEKRAKATQLIEDELSRLHIACVPPQTIDVLLEASVASLPRHP